MADLVELRLRWRDRAVHDPAASEQLLGTQTRRRFLDFVVDGESLYDRGTNDTISCLGWFRPDQDEEAAERLLGQAPPDLENRVALFVCAECADLYCGAVTAVIEHTDGQVIWRDFAYSYPDWDRGGAWEHESLPWPDLRFERRAYTRTIENRASES